MTALHKRTLLVSAMAFMLFPWVASAQAGGTTQDDQQNNQQNDQAGGRKKGQGPFAVLGQKLNLTNDQKRQWAQINRETTQKVRETRKDDSLNEEQMQAQLKEIHKQHNQRIIDLLTPDQQATVKAFWEEQRQKQQNKGNDNNSPSTGPSSQTIDTTKSGEDDLFAGMVSDDPAPAPQPAPKKKAAAPKQ